MRNKIEGIQGLRALAALAVVVFHTNFFNGTWRPMGGFGVCVFFLISGFIMAMICTLNTRHFFLRRLIRIVPLYWALTIAAFLLRTFHPEIGGSGEPGMLELVKSLLFIPYTRDGGIYPVLSVGWSLNYEMCFYLILSIALIVNKKHAATIAAAALIVVMLAAGFFGHGVVREFYFQDVMLDFVGGIVAYKIYTAVSVDQCIRLKPALVAFSLASIALLPLWEITHFYEGRDFRTLVVGVPALLLLQSVVLLAKAGVDLRWRPLIVLGNASYALYLTHTFVLAQFRGIVTRSLPALNPTRLLGMIVVLCVSSAVAIGVHFLLDEPVYTYLNRVLVSRRLKVQSVVQTIP